MICIEDIVYNFTSNNVLLNRAYLLKFVLADHDCFYLFIYLTDRESWVEQQIDGAEIFRVFERI